LSRAPDRAARDFAAVFQEVLNVLGIAKVTLSPEGPGSTFGLTVNRDDRMTQGSLHLQVRMTIQAIEDHGDWAIRTREYQYGLSEMARGERRELLQFHWHGDRSPHVHVGGVKEHVPTGRILLEDVIEYCILERGWDPRQVTWVETLTATRGHFQVHRHWD
jgi:hypothetical protein